MINRCARRARIWAAEMSNKRSISEEKNEHTAKKQKTGHWSMGLLSSLEDPNLFVSSDDLVTVIKDKYPKAEYHYLILPKENISSLKVITKKHLPLLRHMQVAAKKLTEEHKPKVFKIGYHAEPSMVRLHLHVISNDMNSPCLKNKKHWNSFNTDFFLDSSVVLQELEENGKVNIISPVKCKDLINTPLKCNQCKFVPKNIPDLKKHLLSHLK